MKPIVTISHPRGFLVSCDASLFQIFSGPMRHFCSPKMAVTHASEMEIFPPSFYELLFRTYKSKGDGWTDGTIA